MIKVMYYPKIEKEKKDGQCPIFAKISYQNQSITFSTGKSISKERWIHTNRLRSVLKLEKEKVLKKFLEFLELEIEKHFLALLKESPEVSLAALKNRVIGKPQVSETLKNGVVYLFGKHNEYFSKKVEVGERSRASHQKYERAKDLLQTFIQKRYGRADLPISKINGAFIYGLESFLKYESNYRGNIGIRNNSVVKYFKNFQTAFNYCIKLELIEKNPFTLYDGKLNHIETTFLSLDELMAIEEKVFPSQRLDRVRDIFLFSCYTGYAPVDACNLTATNLIKDATGTLWIKTNRAKTAIKANVPVLPPVRRIIEKYDAMQQGLIPRLSNQKMNAYLKEIADVCGINKHLTWYVARHTFATTVTLGNGVRIENVSAMLGHTNLKQTQHYAKVLDANVLEDMNKLIEMF